MGVMGVTIDELLRQAERNFRYAQASNTCVVERLQLPAGCAPTACRLGFERQDGVSRLLIDRGIRYIGRNESLCSFLKDGEYSTDNSEDMTAFIAGLREAYNEALTPPARASPLGGVYDPGRIRPPARPRRKFDRDAFFDDLVKEVRGQNQALEALTDVINTHVRKRKASRPVSVLIAGTSGTGKTLTAETVPKLLTKHTGAEYGYIRIDANQMDAPHTVARLIGAPPGYIGHNEPPLFTPLLSNRRQVILLDEIEKAHPKVLQMLMNVLSNGRLEASQVMAGGVREFDFKEAILIFTSNLPLKVDKPGEMGQGEITRQCRSQLVHPLGNHPPMLPEVAARFTEILLFRELSDADRIDILALSIVRLGTQYDLTVRKISEDLLQAVVDHVTVQNGVRDAEYILESRFGAALAAFADDNDETEVALSGEIDDIQVEPYPDH